jgi:hypothetical protein
MVWAGWAKAGFIKSASKIKLWTIHVTKWLQLKSEHAAILLPLKGGGQGGGDTRRYPNVKSTRNPDFIMFFHMIDRDC